MFPLTGKTVLFAGKQDASDPWQIWELTLADRSLRKVIAGERRCDSAVLSARRAPGLCAAHGARLSTGGRGQGRSGRVCAH